MAIFDKIGAAAKNLADKTNDAIEINKINSKIGSEKNKAAALKVQLGELYWEKFEAGAALDEDAQALCAQIVECMDAIRGYEAEIVRIKVENQKPEPAPAARTCAQCGATLEGEARFCPGCGAKVEQPPAPPAQRFCAGCGAQIGPDAKFCNSCGTKVE